MASLREDKRTGRYYVMFRFGGRQYQRVLTTKRRAAAAPVARVDETIGLIERGRLTVPEDVDPAEFILSDGCLTSAMPKVTHVRLKALTDAYLAKLPTSAKEKSTLQGERIHIEHQTRAAETRVSKMLGNR